MKLITLNTWGGRIYEPLLEFLEKYKDIDVFCFQEVFHNLDEQSSAADFIFEVDAQPNLFNDLEKALPDFKGYFCAIAGDHYGLALFVRKTIEAMETGEATVYENADYDPNDDVSDHTRKIQWARIRSDREYLIMNLHGHWTGQNKNDTPDRLQQSREIISLLEQFPETPKILCGDFNLRPDTESIRMIEKYMVNLIAKHEVQSTRTSLYKKEEKFADYIFTSPEIIVKDFKVLPEEVSDHVPLFCIIE